MDYKKFYEFIAHIKSFFHREGFTEVFSPPIVDNPGIEVNLHPLGLRGVYPKRDLNKFLQTSPEFHMKHLLSHGLEDIFQICFSFRDEPAALHHRKQFLLLEWYRVNTYYHEIKNDIKKLIESLSDFSSQKLNCHELTIEKLFKDHLQLAIMDISEKELNHWCQNKSYYHCYLSYDDLFFLIFLNEIEPRLKDYPLLILDQYPKSMCALATTTKDYSERFEVYINGVEIANCFNELTDLSEQKKRVTKAQEDKSKEYNYSLPEPNILLKSLERGLPISSGIALGVERLYASLHPDESSYFLSSM